MLLLRDTVSNGISETRRTETEIGYPQLVRTTRTELALDQIQWAWIGWIRDRCSRSAAPYDSSKAHGTH